MGDQTTGEPRSELARLRAELGGQGCTYREIAGRIGCEQRVNARVAFRLAHGWTQAQAAERWNMQWPDQEAPRTAKQISYWEIWPAPSGRRPSLDTLNKLAFLYRCSVGELLDGQDHSHLDPEASPPSGPPERSAEPSPAAAAVHLSMVADSTAHPPVPLPDPAGDVAAVRPVLEQLATQLAAQLGGLTAVADGTLGWSARQWDVACQQLVDLFSMWVHTMDRRAVLQVLLPVRFAHEDATRGAQRPTFGGRLGGHVDGPIVGLSLLASSARSASQGPQEVLPRRFRSSALRACGAGRLAIDIEAGFRSQNPRYVVTLSSPIADDDQRSYPQFVCAGSGGTCADGVPSNKVLGWAATATAAGPVLPGLTPDDQERLVAAIQAPGRVDTAVLDHMEQMLGYCAR